jgi:hypothetical protein
MRINDEAYYIVREELGEGDDADHGVTLEPWVEAV